MVQIKTQLKNNALFSRAYSQFIPRFIQISPYLATKFLYKRATKKPLNLRNPTNFNEKIQWLKLYWQHPLVVTCGDKYELRHYAKEAGCEVILNDLYGVYANASEIDWAALPQKFVLKVTSGCGFNIVCPDKQQLDKKAAAAKLNHWLQIDYGLERAELHYSKMTPRIICEKFIETEDGALPIDYKIFCFHGTPRLVLVALDRATEVKRFFFDLDWNPIDFEKGSATAEPDNVTPPKSFKDMLYYAEKLATPFLFVRIDFYDADGQPVLGEMTFTPDRGMATHYNETTLNTLGNMIHLPRDKGTASLSPE
ncbi:TupA-like ATPgrasp [Lentibacillus persicus]|uniref:TupA-like ATPgrasp n=1 Tax=Lentibacillus persicus TaxID=640948 RepID=A0A1I1Y028_9BACI|nr:ATP-grasp fold amidoligase family protein [Lentibacillus persicus]SFE11423.1 TupA-like ATPgrasp [Lentibacillus persicus]